MSWYKVSLSADQVAKGEEMKIQDLFDALFLAAKGPKDMALFTSKLGLGGAQLFFPPSSFPYVKAIIDRYGGEPCEKPDKESVTLLLGHADAKDSLF